MSSDWFATRVAVKREEAAGIYSYELVDPDGKELPAFEAGAHLDVKIGDKIRQFSLSNAPSERHRYLLGVQRELNGRGGSAAFCDNVQEGDTVLIRGPHNLFPLVPDASESVLLAGGIGVTPILAMAERLHTTTAPISCSTIAPVAARGPRSMTTSPLLSSTTRSNSISMTGRRSSAPTSMHSLASQRWASISMSAARR